MFLEPPLRIGRHVIPATGFDAVSEQRIAQVRAAMTARKIKTLLIFGDTIESAELAWLSGMVPWNGWAVMVLPAVAPPTVIVSVGDREMPIARSQTGIADLRNANGDSGETVALAWQLACDATGETGLIGIVGRPTVNEGEVGPLLASRTCARPVEEVSDLVTGPMRRKSTEEIAILRRSAALAQKAVAAASYAGRLRPALAEKAALSLGAHDVRLLARAHGGALSPISLANAEAEALLLAVEQDGYWAAATTDTGSSDSIARRALSAMMRILAPGIALADVAAAAIASLSGSQAKEALGYGLGGAIGLTLSEGPTITADSTDRALSGDIYWLRVLCCADGRLRCASKMMWISDVGAEAF